MHFDLSEAAAVASAGNLARFELNGSINKALRPCMGELLAATGRFDGADGEEVASHYAALISTKPA